MRKLLVVPMLLIAVAACATRKAPATGMRPDVVITQVSGVPPIARFSTGAMSVRYRVRVLNKAKEPITLQRIHIDSLGLGAYVVSHSAPFDVSIDPSRSREVDFWAPTERSENVSGANGPVTLRVVASFNAPGGRFEDVTVQNVSAMRLPR